MKKSQDQLSSNAKVGPGRGVGEHEVSNKLPKP